MLGTQALLIRLKITVASCYIRHKFAAEFFVLGYLKDCKSRDILTEYIQRALIQSNLPENRKRLVSAQIVDRVRVNVSPIVSVALLTFGRIPTRQGQSREYMSRGDMTPLDSARTSRNERLTEKRYSNRQSL
jgi:hypothetical protein